MGARLGPLSSNPLCPLVGGKVRLKEGDDSKCNVFVVKCTTSEVILASHVWHHGKVRVGKIVSGGEGSVSLLCRTRGGSERSDDLRIR